jgi:hypothetical protein
MPAQKSEKKGEAKYQEDEVKEEKHKSKLTESIELAPLNEPEPQSPISPSTTPLIRNKQPSETDLHETKKEAKKESPLLDTRRTKVPSATNLLAPDSPLRSGRGPTSSVMGGDSRKKLSGKKTSAQNEGEIRQSRMCC